MNESVFNISEVDKVDLQNAVKLIWGKGAHNPQEAAIAFKFTQFVERLLAPPPPEPPKEVKANAQ